MLITNKSLTKQDSLNSLNNYLEAASKLLILKIYGRLYQLEIVLFQWNNLNKEWEDNGMPEFVQLKNNIPKMIGDMKILQSLKEPQ